MLHLTNHSCEGGQVKRSRYKKKMDEGKRTDAILVLKKENEGGNEVRTEEDDRRRQ